MGFYLIQIYTDAQRMPFFTLVSLIFKKNTQGNLVFFVSKLCRKRSTVEPR